MFRTDAATTTTATTIMGFEIMATDMESSTVSSPLSSLPDSAPSSPLTEFSTSPSPPPPNHLFQRLDMSYLPSPPSSQQTSQSGSPVPDGTDSGMNTDKEGRPAKRRRISRERTTEHLDLRSGEVDPEQQEELDRLLHVLHKRQKIVVIAGAGISVSAGIPDFRSSNGLFRSLKQEHKLKGSGKHLFDASVYKDDSSTSSFHHMVSSMSRLTKDAKPTAFHHMLATIAKEDRLLRLYSQNVDGIDTSLEPLQTRVPLTKDEGGKWPRTVQLHGGLDKMVCSKCHELSDFEPGLFSGPTPPLCPRCEEIDDIRTIHEGKRSHGIGRLRPRMVLYNEHNPDDIAIGSVTRDDLRRRPDAVIVVGTTLKVPGVRRIVREMCGVVRDRRDGEAIWINNDLPPVAKDLEDCFDIIVRSPCDEVATRAAMRKWDEPVDQEECAEVSEEDALQASEKKGEVHLPELTGESRARCMLQYAKVEELPSSEHINNSFPPSVLRTPSKRPLVSPTDWSPITSDPQTIVPSIEAPSVAAEASVIKVSGLLTPTKSQKTYVDVKPSLATQLGGKPQKKTNKTTNSKAKQGAAKPNKTSRPAKTKKVQNPQFGTMPPGGTLLNFKATKAVAMDARSDSKTASLAPSKLCNVLTASEPMRPVSPNMSPPIKQHESLQSDPLAKPGDAMHRIMAPISRLIH